MKKLIVFILTAAMLLAFGITAAADTVEIETSPTENTATDNSTPETENAATGENSGSEAATEPTVTDRIASYVKEHLEEISVIVSLIAAAVYSKIKDGKLGATLGTLNGNSIKIATKGAEIAEVAANRMADVADKLKEYENHITDKLTEFEIKYGDILRAFEESEGERLALADVLKHVDTVLKAVKCAVAELADEVANLICLANIPNAKKDEFYSNHLEAVKHLKDIEEGSGDDGQKA